MSSGPEPRASPPSRSYPPRPRRVVRRRSATRQRSLPTVARSSSRRAARRGRGTPREGLAAVGVGRVRHRTTTRGPRDPRASRQLPLEIATAILARATTPRGRRHGANVKLIAESDLGRFDDARRTSEQCLACARELADDEILSVELGNAAEVAFRAGDTDAAARFQREELALALQLGSVVQSAFAIVLAARLAAQQHKWPTAVELQTAADALLDKVGVELYPSDAKLTRVAAARRGNAAPARRAGRSHRSGATPTSPCAPTPLLPFTTPRLVLPPDGHGLHRVAEHSRQALTAIPRRSASRSVSCRSS